MADLAPNDEFRPAKTLQPRRSQHCTRRDQSRVLHPAGPSAVVGRVYDGEPRVRIEAAPVTTAGLLWIPRTASLSKPRFLRKEHVRATEDIEVEVKDHIRDRLIRLVGVGDASWAVSVFAALSKVTSIAYEAVGSVRNAEAGASSVSKSGDQQEAKNEQPKHGARPFALEQP